MVLETIWFREACLGFFPHFPHYFILLFPFGDFAILEEFWTFLEEKRGFLAFWRHFRPFGGFLDDFMAF